MERGEEMNKLPLGLQQWFDDRLIPYDFVTELFPADTKPAKPGVYWVEAKTPKGRPVCGWAYWGGVEWGITCAFPDTANRVRGHGVIQDKAWIALTREVIGAPIPGNHRRRAAASAAAS
jgi:hypothetical protein